MTKTARFLPPEALLEPIELPDRSKIATAGDMVMVILADEKAIALKNADLAALREYRESLLHGGGDD